MASFYIPLTGLTSDSTALNTIANDLANMNTTAFKSQTVNFSDLFYQQIGSTGSGDPIQRGSGTQVANIATDFTTGSPNSTGVDTDVALQGDGFFVVSDGANQYLTRAGDFSTDQAGNLITSSGLNVMGYPAANGVVNTNAPLAPVKIPKTGVEPPQATSSFGMSAILNASAVANDPSGVLTAKVPVYDSLGKEYQAQVTYTKTAQNTWAYSINLPDTLAPNSNTANGITTITYDFGTVGGATATVNPETNLTITGATAGSSATIVAPVVTASESLGAYAADLQTAVNNAGIQGVTIAANGNQLTVSGASISASGAVIQDAAAANATGTLTFDANGNLVSPATNVPGITFGGLSDGAAALNMTWNLFGADGKGTISQVAEDNSSVSATTQNGYASGEFSGFSIGSDGTVTTIFTNGQKLNVAQIALGNVVNLQGLKDMGNGEYETTMASGTATVGVSGTAGLGTMQGGALEASNVNISAEFSNLIIAQRAFEANSKAVTTFDTVTQETINMIH